MYQPISFFPHSQIKQDKPYFLASCNFMKRKCNQLIVREKIESPSLLHIRFNYVLVSKVLYQLGMMMHSSNPAFRRWDRRNMSSRPAGIQETLCHKARINYNNNNKMKYTSSIQPSLLCQSGLTTRTELIHSEYNYEDQALLPNGMQSVLLHLSEGRRAVKLVSAPVKKIRDPCCSPSSRLETGRLSRECLHFKAEEHVQK